MSEPSSILLLFVLNRVECQCLPHSNTLAYYVKGRQALSLIYEEKSGALVLVRLKRSSLLCQSWEGSKSYSSRIEWSVNFCRIKMIQLISSESCKPQGLYVNNKVHHQCLPNSNALAYYVIARQAPSLICQELT